jgi:hypothetical protein
MEILCILFWNAPAQINHPRRIVAERARWFRNLVFSASPRINT